MLFSALLVVAALAGSGFAAEVNDCKLSLQTLVPHNEPLILEVDTIRGNKEQLSIAYPSVEDNDGKREGIVAVHENKKLLIACTGAKNTNVVTHTQTAYVKCLKGQLTIGNQPANAKTLFCQNGVADSWIKNTGESCANNEGTKFELGFQLTDDKSDTFFPMIEVCHNINEMSTYYSSHEVFGASLRGAVKSSERRPFKQGPPKLGIYKGLNVDKAYTQKGQNQTFDFILGKGAKDNYMNKTMSRFLARGHLAPDADFIYNSGQQLTYFFTNVAPQWQPFNAGNWLGVENAVRDLAAKENATLSVYTGTYGVLKLKDNNGEEQEIYLDPAKTSDEVNHLPVPEVYWKVVRHPVKMSCTVAVGHNNVFLEEPPTPICDTVDVDGWPKLTTLSRGYVYYCDYESFRKTVPYVPRLTCKDTLEFPEIHG